MSMKDAGIHLLAVHRSCNGQVIVARLNDEVTVKRLKRNRQRAIFLLPENTRFKPIKIKPGDELEIEGIGVGVLRNGKAL